jgi:hypothetical protein
MQSVIDALTEGVPRSLVELRTLVFDGARKLNGFGVAVSRHCRNAS